MKQIDKTKKVKEWFETQLNDPVLIDQRTVQQTNTLKKDLKHVEKLLVEQILSEQVIKN